MNLNEIAINGTNIPVQQCTKFMDDVKFGVARDTLIQNSAVEDWQNIIQKKLPEIATGSNLNIVNEKENIYFLNDRFELLVDVRGFAPQDIRCTVTEIQVEVIATRCVKQEGNSGLIEQTQSLNRSYFLPQAINPLFGSCLLSTDGILVVTAPWKP